MTGHSKCKFIDDRCVLRGFGDAEIDDEKKYFRDACFDNLEVYPQGEVASQVYSIYAAQGKWIRTTGKSL